MTILYVYYQVQADQAATLSPAVGRMQARLRSTMPGLAANLSRRVPDPSSLGADSPTATPSATPETWMEIYQFNGHADHRAWLKLVTALDTAVAQLPSGMLGQRHVEWFDRIGT